MFVASRVTLGVGKWGYHPRQLEEYGGAYKGDFTSQASKWCTRLAKQTNKKVGQNAKGNSNIIFILPFLNASEKNQNSLL